MFVFKPGLPIPFLSALDIPYILLCNGDASILLLTRLDATDTIKKMVAEGFLSAEEGAQREEELKSLTLLDNWDQIRQKILNYQLEETEFPFQFELCDCGAALHGYIINREGISLVQFPVESLYDGCAQIDTGMNAGYLDLNNAVALLKRMVEYKLPGSFFETTQEDKPPTG